MLFLYKFTPYLTCYKMMFSLYNTYLYTTNKTLIYLYIYVSIIASFNLEISNFY